MPEDNWSDYSLRAGGQFGALRLLMCCSTQWIESCGSNSNIKAGQGRHALQEMANSLKDDKSRVSVCDANFGVPNLTCLLLKFDSRESSPNKFYRWRLNSCIDDKLSTHDKTTEAAIFTKSLTIWKIRKPAARKTPMSIVLENDFFFILLVWLSCYLYTKSLRHEEQKHFLKNFSFLI